MAKRSSSVRCVSSMYGEHWSGRKLNDDLENFRRNGMTAGLEGLSRRCSPIEEKDVAFPARSQIQFVQLMNVAKKSFVKRMIDVGVGNPYYGKVDDFKVTCSDIEACFNAWRIGQYAEPKRIVEIGAGFGCLSAMLRKLYPQAHITIVDLPEHKRFQEYYIDNVVGMDGFEITTELPDDADLVIALRCLMEMPISEVNKYFEWIQSLESIRHLYIINRYMKRNTFKFYPFDSKWKMLISQTFWPSAEMHELFLERVKTGSDELGKALLSLPPFISGKTALDYGFNPPIVTSVQ